MWGELASVDVHHVMSLVEAAYQLERTPDEWLQSVVAAASAANGAGRAMAFRYDVSGGDWVNTGMPALHDLSADFAGDFLNQSDAPPEAARALASAFHSLRVASTRNVLERVGMWSAIEPVFRRHGVDDLLAVNAVDPSGRGCMLTLADPGDARSPRTMQVWHRLSAHISAGNRLRTSIDALVRDATAMERAEAVLSPNGSVEDAKGAAQPRAAREALRSALVRIDKARSRQQSTHESVELWRGLVAGRWSLVEHFERDGRRYYLAHKNDPEVTQDARLTPRERQVLAYAELGNSNKLTAYALGLSTSTVSALLGRARRKIGAAPR